MIRAINPDYLGTNGASALAALTIESFRKAHVKKDYAATYKERKKPFRNIDSDIEYHLGAFLPIPNPPCMLLHHLFRDKARDADDAAEFLDKVVEAVGGDDPYDEFLQGNHCSDPLDQFVR